jgi:hypothetical protein
MGGLSGVLTCPPSIRYGKLEKVFFTRAEESSVTTQAIQHCSAEPLQHVKVWKLMAVCREQPIKSSNVMTTGLTESNTDSTVGPWVMQKCTKHFLQP